MVSEAQAKPVRRPIVTRVESVERLTPHMIRIVVAGDDLNVTHESIAVMLGVRRPGVTVALQTLESMGLIRGARARTRIVDRAGLEQLADGAYGVAEKEYRRLIGPFGKSAPDNDVPAATPGGGKA